MAGYETADQQFRSFEALAKRLDEETDILDDRREAVLEQAKVYSNAKRDAVKFRANAFLTDVGTVAEREYEAKKAAADKEHEARVEEALHESAKSAYYDQMRRVDNVRSKFQALQTIASTSRAQMELAR